LVYNTVYRRKNEINYDQGLSSAGSERIKTLGTRLKNSVPFFLQIIAVEPPYKTLPGDTKHEINIYRK
jgi:hypothetical protein